MRSLADSGIDVQPVEIEGRKIAHSFWGRGWCEHLESFADFSNRLPRGRTYARNGSVCHLTIQAGRIEAIVSGSQLYDVEIEIAPIDGRNWTSIKERTRDGIGSLLELLRGQLSERVMAIVSHSDRGLFPHPREIELNCSCPDWAVLCKHVAAVLYGIGNRLDHEPELLFTLRGVDPTELISSAASSIPESPTDVDGVIADDQLGEIFDIELDDDAVVDEAQPVPVRKARSRAKKKAPKKSAKKTAIRTEKRAAKQAASKPRGPEATAPSKSAKPRRITGRSIARLRRDLCETRAEFANEVGVTTSTVARWEATRGALSLHARTRAKLESILE